MLPIEANTLPKTPMIAREKQRSWRQPGTMRQEGIKFQAHNHKHEADCQETKAGPKPTSPVLTYLPPREEQQPPYSCRYEEKSNQITRQASHAKTHRV